MHRSPLKKAASILLFISCFLLLCSPRSYGLGKPVKGQSRTIVIPKAAHARVEFGANRLATALQAAGYQVKVVKQDKLAGKQGLIVIGKPGDELLQKATTTYQLGATKTLAKEGFAINSAKSNVLVITGADDSGALYGCLELADQVKEKQALPEQISYIDQPEMVLRGTCIGVQKPTYLPGRGVYEYPYTPEVFPWLYDKELWVKYLDMMVENRYNSLYLWNGHPFASLVRLKEYPYAVEVDEATFKKNEEIFGFVTKEADKRGIWVIQMFYNIIVSKPFAEHHNIKTQDRNRPIVPLIADYTRKSIAAFVEKYPNVGLMVALGEAMEGVGQDDVDWFTKTIIPGVQDGLKALGQTTQPPIVLRAHDTDAQAVMKAALPIYKNLYTEAKFNGEALTTYTPRGPWAELHRNLSRIGTVQIENVHILANLEPFRYGSADFMQKSVQAMHNVYEANGLHLYPQASYWDWPYTADKVAQRQLQVDRDWIWYKGWARYAWKANRPRPAEVNYWGSSIGEMYGCDEQAGKAILEAYEESGEISPKLLRRYGITDGNRQTLTLGMLMGQLINPNRYGLFTLLYNSEAPEGEMIIEYAAKEAARQPHIGETPPQVADEVVVHGRKAVAAIEKAAPSVTKNKEEFERLKNDMYCYDAMANFYAEKARAAVQVLRYKYSNNVADLELAVPPLQRSIEHFKKLVEHTQNAYLYANSMQTSQRKIPMRGVDGTYKTWVEMLPVYEKELTNFRHNIDSLKAIKPSAQAKKLVVLKNAPVNVLSKVEGYYTIAPGQEVFADTTAQIKEFASELVGLKGVLLSKASQQKQGTEVKFSATKPVKVLVGYFEKKGAGYLQAPQLETDASANDFGQADTKTAHALLAGNQPPVNVHTFSFKAGTHTLNLNRGACLILGFIDGNQDVRTYDAGLGTGGEKKEIDWLFE
ncbi:alpha-d-galacturonidase [Hymenobacter crusticola]|uniref:alpha-d-galacturonidase n=1 Tax=Hymenobacter crusticola TaxID=1770526 RepID=UPI001FE2E8C3|nr:alpha-glucuronidase family glycosyl hydrolase [Hymenobacter crusticola]